MKWFKELRMTHYLKNGLIFLPVLFGGKLFGPVLWKDILVGFLCFCMGASFVYLVNDIKDVEKDKKHPVKRMRPIANGDITVRQGLFAAALLLAADYAGLFFLISDGGGRWKAVLVMTLYLVINILYSVAHLKDIPLLDVAFLVAGFYLRVLMGSVLSGISISSWLYLVIITGAFYLGFGKRRNEFHFGGSGTRGVMSGYTEHFLDHAMYGCMHMTIIFFALWCVEKDMGTPFLILVPILMLACYRYTMDIEQKESDGDPMNVILKDKVLIGFGIVFLAVMTGLLYF